MRKAKSMRKSEPLNTNPIKPLDPSEIDWAGLIIEYGEPVRRSEPMISRWRGRRVVAMNFLGRNVRNNTSDWELFLECRHSVREQLGYDEAPKGLYRDCDSTRNH